MNLQTLTFRLMNDTLTFMYNFDRKEILECIAEFFVGDVFLIRPSPKLIT